jgi:hypothetical protein
MRMVWFAALSYQKGTFIHFQSTLRSTRFTLGCETKFPQKPESTALIGVTLAAFILLAIEVDAGHSL